MLVPVKRQPAPVIAVAEAGAVEPPVETVVRPNSNGHFITFAKVDGEATRFVVDTGADMVALTMEDARRAKIDFDPNRFEVVARGASGDVLGQNVVIDEISLDGKRAHDVHGAVIRDLDISLLGQSYLRHLKSVQMSGGEMRLR
ncbi:TIGR02281 family clan AA aspartic protease [Sphingomonas sp. JC676]|uniref:retropepsin-like aspartic protease family protein n=1 Tax=Sphingomonas sp. JC676 TaxID=2768065 RepID=UPI0016578248|nr:TIGR02281 family clan AA aspartic protease [Sphingomonas sp. JC676]MBC9034829.1 TIGR02281 family clan AA aspartic protease [Sphingomonas sp. JC676]